MPNPRTGLRVARSTLLLALVSPLLLVGCGDAASEAGADSASSANGTPGEVAPAKASTNPSPKRPSRRPSERPLPSFEGRLLDGEKRSISDYIGRRLVLFLFNPERPETAPVAGAVATISKQGGAHNFEVVGIALGSSPSKTREFAAERGLDFPIFDDSSARISQRLGLRTPLAVLGIDGEGYLSFGMASFATDVPDAEGVLATQLRERLRLPEPALGGAGRLDKRPLAPDFEAQRLGGGEPFRLSDHAGKPVILIFFLHTCSHCHEALGSLRSSLDEVPEEKRPKLVGISVENKPTSVRAMLREKKLDYFPVLVDADASIRGAYGVFAGVPDLVMIAADGHIQHRIQGWREDRDPALSRMVVAKLAGTPVPMILNPKGYTGSDVCGVCHEAERASWEFTNHASAFDTLVEHGADVRNDCVDCHVVGFEKAGGYDLEARPGHLEDVGCESCHGRGGPHLSPNFVHDDQYQAACLGCHNEKHSLGFDYASFLPKVSHAAVSALSVEDREAMLANRGKPRDLLPKQAALVGSESCAECHAGEYATWAKSPHASAVLSLQAKQEASNTECLRCHTTGFGKTGGFPENAAVADHPDLARVGCESCHGAGGEHVSENAARRGTIVSLGDKCDSCVILQICGSCHDEANDPGFRFDVEAHIERQRHGTIEAGTGKPIGEQAERAVTTEALLAHVFAGSLAEEAH